MTQRGQGPGVLLRFELGPESAIPTPEAVARKWGAWRDILRGRTPAERAELLREATFGYRQASASRQPPPASPLCPGEA